MASYFISIGIIVSLMVAWVGIQFLWKIVFADQINSDDALEDRSKCGQCNCGTICKKKNLKH